MPAPARDQRVTDLLMIWDSGATMPEMACICLEEIMRQQAMLQRICQHTGRTHHEFGWYCPACHLSGKK